MSKTETCEIVPALSEREIRLAEAFREALITVSALETELQAAQRCAREAQDGLAELRGHLDSLRADVERHGREVARAGAAAESAELKALFLEFESSGSAED